MPSIKTIIKVFPKDRNILKKKKKPYEEQTIVCETSDGIIYYYQYFINKLYGIELEKSSFKAHITINNGKEPIKLNNPLLKEINNKVITVKYNPEPYILWKFIAIEIYSEQLDNIRKKLNLSDNFKFHLTLGKIKEKSLPQSKSIIDRGKINYQLTSFPIKYK